jgi:hypothetical protein
MSKTETPLTRAERHAQALKGVRWYLVRRWLYWVAAAALTVLVYYRVIEAAALPVLLPLILAALNSSPAPLPGETPTE